MREYYEPNLYVSTSENPNIMGSVIHLKEEVDGDLLREVCEELRVRFPYFYVTEVFEGDELRVTNNPLPMTVRNSWDPIDLNSSESNYHLAAFKYEGKRLALEMLHALSDGAGILPYVKSIMYMYLSKKYGQSFDPEGFRLPGDEIPESETGDPFAALAAQIKALERPAYIREYEAEFMRILPDDEKDPRISYIRIPEDQLMQYCRSHDGSPNAFIAVMLAKAARRLQPETEKPFRCIVAIDHKALLGNYDNYRMFAGTINIEFPAGMSLEDTGKACTIGRGQMVLLEQPENSMWAIKNRMQMRMIPEEMLKDIVVKRASTPSASATVSYANSRSFGPLDPYIDQFYNMAEACVSDVICEVTCINHNFFMALSQQFSTGKYVESFCEELKKENIEYEVMGMESFRPCGMKDCEK